MKRTARVLTALAGIAMLASCADTQGIASQIGNETTRFANKMVTDWTGGAFKKGPLYHVMYATGDGWPRAAITINKLPPHGYDNYMTQGDAKGADCINVSVTLWRDAKTSQRFDNVDFCSADFQGRFGNTVIANFMLWAGQPSESRNTGTNRTQGPIPPRYPAPRGSDYDRFATSYGMGFFYQMAYSMGYDLGGEMHDDHRLWIVHMPAQ